MLIVQITSLNFALFAGLFLRCLFIIVSDMAGRLKIQSNALVILQWFLLCCLMLLFSLLAGLTIQRFISGIWFCK